jgi:hypothetical protein
MMGLQGGRMPAKTCEIVIVFQIVTGYTEQKTEALPTP